MSIRIGGDDATSAALEHAPTALLRTLKVVSSAWKLRVRHELCLPAVPLEGWEHKRSIQRQRECKPRAECLALLTEVDVALSGMHKGE